MTSNIVHRKNIRELSDLYLNNDKKPLSDVLRAWQGITTLKHVGYDYVDPNSFWLIAGYHGEPFRGAGWGNASWWGGYCNHGNVLFPTWHRAYLHRLEKALQSVVPGVALPYWNEIEEETKNGGVPWVFTTKRIELDTGETIDNPLFSYKFQLQVWDNSGSPSTGDYYKSRDYVTKRFPYSGFDGQVTGDTFTQKDVDEYNAWIDTHTEEEIVEALNDNVQQWVNPSTSMNSIGIAHKYEKALTAPNYTVFSNTTSAAHYNQTSILDVGSSTLNPPKYPDGRTGSPEAEVPLESPHNDMHLAVGGFNLMQPVNNFDANPDHGFPKDANSQGGFPNFPGLPFPGFKKDKKKTFEQANGDMGENNTAAFDPIFFFHHCFVDKVFWDWQKLHQATEELEIIPGYPGTNSVDSQGPTPGVAGGTWLTLDSPLEPFKQGADENGPVMTSKHVVNIENQLNYTYDEYFRPEQPLPMAPSPRAPVKHHAHVSGINRGSIGGSFVIEIRKHHDDGKVELLGFESVLSRWETAGCANCQTHLNVRALIPLPGVTDDDIKNKRIRAVVNARTKGGSLLVGGGKPPHVEPKILQSASSTPAAAGQQTVVVA